MMAFSDSSAPWLVFPSLLALSYGGGTLLLTNVQLSSLFPRASGVIVTLISGGVDFSATTQLLVKLLREAGIARKSSYIGITIAHACLAMISTMFFLPKKLYTRRPSIFQFRADDIDLERLNTIARKALAAKEEDESQGDDEYDKREVVCDDQCGDDKRNTCQEGMRYGNHTNNNCHKTSTVSSLQHTGSDLILDPRTLLTSVEELDTRCGACGKHVSTESVGKVRNNTDSLTSALQRESTCHTQQRKGSMFDGNIPKCSLPYSGNHLLTEEKKVYISIVDVRFPSQVVKPNEKDEKTITKDVSTHSDGRPPRRQSDRPTAHVRLVFPEFSKEANEMEDGDAPGSNLGSPVPQTSSHELYPTLKSCVTSPVFVLHVLWTSFNVLRLASFFGLINSKLNAMFEGNTEKVSFYTNVLAYFMLSMMCVCWVSGAVYDWQSSVFRGRRSLFQKKVLPGALPLAMTSALGVAISAMALSDSEMVLYFMFACFVFYNAFIFGVCLSFLMRVFPERFFGILNGVLSIVSGIFCFLQYGIFRWHDVQPDGPVQANIFMLSLVAVSFVHPLYLVLTCLRR
ncbi:uncharacterized protein LOC112565444 [Pomacea canaliculata]|uniref:uncharacterized protein LOC112565444 n=1 Tax=Pomacea canaliculata TaxID=400727 RepID=UPI000D7301AC|nr:uncharacterized protein LOC112565444 [Pomacea canaliculata]